METLTKQVIELLKPRMDKLPKNDHIKTPLDAIKFSVCWNWAESIQDSTIKNLAWGFFEGSNDPDLSEEGIEEELQDCEMSPEELASDIYKTCFE